MSKEYYKNKIDSIKREIAQEKSKITSHNDKIKDLQEKKKEKRAYYSKLIKGTSSSESKKSYRISMNSDLKRIEEEIAYNRNRIADIKRLIESKKRDLKNAQASYKNAK